jgi:hypothetical protein
MEQSTKFFEEVVNLINNIEFTADFVKDVNDINRKYNTLVSDSSIIKVTHHARFFGEDSASIREAHQNLKLITNILIKQNIININEKDVYNVTSSDKWKSFKCKKYIINKDDRYDDKIYEDVKPPVTKKGTKRAPHVIDDDNDDDDDKQIIEKIKHLNKKNKQMVLNYLNELMS